MGMDVYFYERVIVNPGSAKPYRYRNIDVKTRPPVSEVPVKGDKVQISGKYYAVLDRFWTYATRDSGDCPHMVDLVVEETQRQWADEAELSEAEKAEIE